MTWLSWRQLRMQAAAIYTLVVAAAVVLAITGPALFARARIDTSVFDHMTRTERDLYYAGVIVLALAPAVIGAFWGAPLVARELEAGTHQLVWTQSVTRTRWLAAKLGLTLLAGAAATGALSLAITWWSGPVDGALSGTHGSLPSRLTPVGFAMRGVAPVAYTVFAVVLGVAVGAVLRRSLPAMALTLAIFVAVQIATPLWVRPHLIPPVRSTVTLSLDRLDGISGDPSGRAIHVELTTGHHGDWVLANDTVDAAGHSVSLPAWAVSCLTPPPVPTPDTATVVKPAARDNLAACFARMDAAGYRQLIVYQPADRFWPLQFAETAVFLAGSGLLAWFSFWWVRRRLS